MPAARKTATPRRPKKAGASAAAAPAVVQAAAREAGIINYLAYQKESVIAPWRISIDEWARQTGKTFTNSSDCLRVCCTQRHAHVVTMSASLRQGEMVIRKDAEIWRSVVEKARQRFQETARESDRLLIRTPADNDSGTLIDIDGIAEMLQAGRLEARIYWGNSTSDYSLHQLFAANPETARGATAARVFWDEAFLTPEFKECLRALRSMIRRRPEARIKIASSPPISSSHESWELMYHENTYPVNPAGNWRTAKAGQGEDGIPILRVDAYDAEAAGIVTYDEKTGKPIGIREERERTDDKEGYDREALLIYRSSGSVLIPYSCLVRAQTAGAALAVPGTALDLGAISDLNTLSDDGLRAALRQRVPAHWTAALVPGKDTAFGHDQSTSDKSGTSNPSSFVVIQEDGIERPIRLAVRWLSRFPRVNEFLMEMLLLDARSRGVKMAGLGIDASNEYFHAQRLQSLFSWMLPCILYKGGEKHPARPTSWKEHLGSQYAQLFLDSLTSLPPRADWLLQDHSLVVRTPSGITNLTSRGIHADVFDGAKLAAEILQNNTGPLMLSAGEINTVTARAAREDGDDDDAPGFLIGTPPGTGSVVF